MNGPIRVVFMGTPDFAVYSLRALATAPDVELLGVVTQPDRPTGRKQVLTPSPVKTTAMELGVPIFQPEKVGAPDVLDQLRGLNPDVIVTAAYGQLLPQRLLDIPKRGCLNVHASLLPRWRGAAPIHRSIIDGDRETGVAVMEMVKALDAGPVVGVKVVPITDADNVGTLHDKLAQVGANLLVEVLPGYVQGDITPVPQPEDGVTYAERIRREDEYLDWNRPTKSLYNQIRGLSPWPGATTRLGNTEMKIWSASIAPSELRASERLQGTVFEVDGLGIGVKTSDGVLILGDVQPSGKRKMAASAWFRGIPATPIVLT